MMIMVIYSIMETLRSIRQRISQRLQSVSSGVAIAAAGVALVVVPLQPAQVLAMEETPPTITITPGEHEGKMTLQATADQEVSDWEFLRSSSAFDCDSDVFDQYEPIRGQNYFYVPDQFSDNFTYCIRAKNANDIWGYASHRIDLSPPTITVNHTSVPGQVTITATANEPVTWRYYVVYDDRCGDEKAWERSPKGPTHTDTGPVMVCYQAVDQSGKEAYKVYEVEEVQPLAQPDVRAAYYAATNKIVARANKSIASWAYLLTRQKQDCAQADYSNPTGRTNQVEVSPASYDQHYCFQATDIDDLVAHDGITITAAIKPEPVTPPVEEQPTAPEIAIDASGRQITASHSEPVAKWRYYRSPAEPACDATVNWDSDQNSAIVRGRQVTGLTSADVGQWVCFRALLLGTTYRGQEVYQPVQISNSWSDPDNTQTLAIKFSQTATTLTATASPAVPTDRYQYLTYSGDRYPNGPNCTADNPNMTAEYWTRWKAATGNVVQLVQQAEGYYYCFRVVDNNGGASYAMHRVTGVKRPSTTAPTTTPTETSTVRQLEVKVSQTPMTLTATTNIAAPGARWQYLRFSSDKYPNGPKCNADNEHMTDAYWNRWAEQAGNTNVVNLQASDEGYYYCFRVVDASNNVAYGEHKVTGVDTSTATATVVETESETATAAPAEEAEAAPVVTVINPGTDSAPQVTVNPGSVTVNPGSVTVNPGPAPQVTVNPGPAPQVTVNPAPVNTSTPIEVTVNMPEAPAPAADQPGAEPIPVAVADSDDNRVTEGLLWGLGGAIATLVILTSILSVVDRNSRRR